MGEDEQLLEEIEVLQSIYGDSVRVDLEGERVVSYRDEERDLVLTFFVPPQYPHTQTETETLRVEVGSILSKMRRQREVQACVESTLGECAGEVAMFRVIEAVKELLDSDSDTHTHTHAGDDSLSHDHSKEERTDYESPFDSHTHTHSAEDATESAAHCPLHIVHGPVTMENKSSFQTHLAAVRSMEEVRLFRSAVLQDKKAARATHNIFAYRFTCPETQIVFHDCDDDGETAAGSRLAEMMRLMGVDGVAVVVSRWFGGVLLGPDRFKFICNSARHLLEEEGFGDCQQLKRRAGKHADKRQK